MDMKKILVTGSAGFIGFHLVERLLINENYEIIGIDSIDPYYDINLKLERLNIHGIEIKGKKKLFSKLKI